MRSLTELFKIGSGPSSSHTMGPEKAARIFRSENEDADQFKALIYGSLAKTGKGHMTDKAIIRALSPAPAEVQFAPQPDFVLPHPNTMDLFAYKDGRQIAFMRAASIGGGDIVIEGREETHGPDVYPENSFAEISAFCKANHIRLSDYVEQREGKQIWDFLQGIWEAMKRSIDEGLSVTGILEGGLHVERKAKYLYHQGHVDESPETRENRIVSAYAFAVNEQNAAAGTVVTAPTCGASGVVPASLRYMQEKMQVPDARILRALAVGGLIGNLVKQNASISGAQCGCQAEVGTACSMAAAALAELSGMEIDQIEYAAEVAMEHHLGLTCDPINGLVQIPCIERNAVGAMRAINALSLAKFLSGTRKISFDLVVQTMYETGQDMNSRYRETAEGGLAKLYKIDS
ncbi:L-serine ammonia-lyase, iron-sulfur-dependent, subunit alpha [Paenibacillus sp. JNUCC31]|uniref:L-serine ammonia-lyase, iron-sulfur-dependent, subunit alpha n=1 Tax=Paenibacillus sp. JNUCC-31 TaxID=2777983 RepID=UPI00178718D3|nr:L-serine ammonia-lyase, iron-sulfur-dependent, subunit alpha [Paenibacillus sp. JNUCC-31]QOS78485.1 L-serine ammonia-lyase, iron-sulfur-dependent, subunit alpha [Paenibacillus sp. JNUCC-31]